LIAGLQSDELQKFTKDELRTYLVHYGVTPDPRKPEMKQQVRRLIVPAVAGVLTQYNGHIVCGQKERGKPVTELIKQEAASLVLSPKAIKQEPTKKDVSTCRNCGKHPDEQCQYKRCLNCCVIAGLMCACHSPNSRKRKISHKAIQLSELEQILHKKQKLFRSDLCLPADSVIDLNNLRVEEDPLLVVQRKALERFNWREALVREIFSETPTETILEEVQKKNIYSGLDVDTLRLQKDALEKEILIEKAAIEKKLKLPQKKTLHSLMLQNLEDVSEEETAEKMRQTIDSALNQDFIQLTDVPQGLPLEGNYRLFLDEENPRIELLLTLS